MGEVTDYIFLVLFLLSPLQVIESKRMLTNLIIPLTVAIFCGYFYARDALSIIFVCVHGYKLIQRKFSNVYVYNGQEPQFIPRTIKHLKVANGVTLIPPDCFQYFVDLVSVELPEGLQVVGARSFASCRSLRTINVPSSVTEIESSAFHYCTKLEEIDLPEGLLKIGEQVWLGCEALRAIRIPSTVIVLESACFGRCRSLARLDIPEGSLQRIPSAAFYGCDSLTTVKLPSSLRALGQAAFFRCKSLVSVELPRYLEELGEQVFDSCEALTNLYFPTMAIYNEGNMFNGCFTLRLVFPEGQDLKDAFMKRFDELPIHHLLYFGANEESTLRAISEIPENCDVHTSIGKADDYFGMTAFHILSLSANLQIGMFDALIKKCSSIGLLTKTDKMGYSPIDYVCLNSSEDSLLVMKCMIDLTISRRLSGLGIGHWRIEILYQIDKFVKTWDRCNKREQFNAIRDLLANLEARESMSLLESAVWKHTIDKHKETLLLPDDRLSCRITCGADIVIVNVLPFLGKAGQDWATM